MDGTGRLDFDRSGFRAICAREDLLGSAQGGPRIYGVKSFEHAIDRLEERCHAALDLIPAFDERYICSDSDWESSLYLALRSFLLTAAKDQPRLRLALDTHVNLALAAGSIINIKSGRHVELEQRSTGRRLWAADDIVSDANFAVAISLTHDVSADVRRYCEARLPHVGRLLILKPSTGSGLAAPVAAGVFGDDPPVLSDHNPGPRGQDKDPASKTWVARRGLGFGAVPRRARIRDRSLNRSAEYWSTAVDNVHASSRWSPALLQPHLRLLSAHTFRTCRFGMRRAR